MASVSDVRQSTPSLLSWARMATLVGSILVTLNCGTLYIYSAYAPQLGARLGISNTQLNIVGLAANVGVYISGPLWGRITDATGPRLPLIGASLCYLVGYAGIKWVYDDGIGSGASIPLGHFPVLIACSFLTGLATTAAQYAATNATAKSFPDSVRATAISLVDGGLGLSAFCFSTTASIFFPGDTSALLLCLTLATSITTSLGVLVVRPVSLPPTRITTNADRGEVCVSIPREDAIRSSTHQEDIADLRGTERDCCTPLMGDQLENTGRYVLEPCSAQERGRAHHRGPARPTDIHGKVLWRHPEFYVMISILSLLGGAGVMYINNVGSISYALYAYENTNYDPTVATEWQAKQISTLSIGNFAGRVLIGLISDFMRTQLHLPRSCILSVVSLFFIISQVAAICVTSISALWVASATLGFADGCMYSIVPTITIEWFGLAHLSENMGCIMLSPLVGGNLFSVMFGTDLDAHTRRPRPDSGQAPGVWAAIPFVKMFGGVLPEHQCMLGRECYVTSFCVTLVACTVALALSIWAGIRHGRNVDDLEQKT